ncbi:MAG: carbohydrate-binding protein, partial [Micromonosporaceae bacterium]
PPALGSEPGAQAAWELRWAPEPSRDGMRVFDGVEDDRANSHPAGQPHIYVADNNYRFNMHMVDRDTYTDRQRQEVRGMRWPAGGSVVRMYKGQTWRITYSMYIPSSLKATTSFTHIMQMKAPGSTPPIIVTSLRRVNGAQTIELKVFGSGTLVGRTDLVALHNRWIDIEFEMTVGDAPNGRVRWVIRSAGSTVLDVSRSGVDTWLRDWVHPKFGIYRSLGDSSGSLQNCHLLIRNLRAYRQVATASSRYEAENATIYRGQVDSDHAGFSGGGFVNYYYEVGSYVQWTVNAATAGSRTLTFRYANGTSTNRPMDIRVNGALAADELAFPGTGAWSTWQTRSMSAYLNAGANTVRATATTANGGPNVDYLEVQQ